MSRNFPLAGTSHDNATQDVRRHDFNTFAAGNFMYWTLKMRVYFFVKTYLKLAPKHQKHLNKVI